MENIKSVFTNTKKTCCIRDREGRNYYMSAEGSSKWVKNLVIVRMQPHLKVNILLFLEVTRSCAYDMVNDHPKNGEGCKSFATTEKCYCKELPVDPLKLNALYIAYLLINLIIHPTKMDYHLIHKSSKSVFKNLKGQLN